MKLLGGISYDYGAAITVGLDNSIYVTGYTGGDIDDNRHIGSDDIFITKFDSSGNKIWTKIFGTRSSEDPYDISTANDGSIYIVGSGYGSTTTQSNAGGEDALIAKYDQSGNLIWVKLFGSTNSDRAKSIAVCSDGSIYVAGETNGNIDGIANPELQKNPNDGNQIFVTHLSSDGNKLWTKYLGVSSTYWSPSITMGSDGLIYVTGTTKGSFYNQVDFGKTASFLTCFNSSGEKLWTEFIGSTGYDKAYSATASNDGFIFIAGETYRDLDAFKSASNANRAGDGFIIKLQPSSLITNASVVGTSASEIFNTSTGNDSINGGGGIDIVVVSAGIGNYSVTKTSTGYTLVDRTGSDGTDTLLNIEAIKFSDKTINLTVQAKAASAPQADVTRLVELYTAFFNRVPDADGMSFWIDEMKAGKTTNQVAEAFYNAGVNYSSLTGFSSTMKNADFINVIYKNVLGRKDGADAGGLSFWEGEITSGRATRGTLVTNILDSAHTFKGNATWGWVADLLDNKITVAKKFSIDMGLNYNTPEESITKGMAIASAITPTDTSAAVTLIGVAEANFYLS